MSLHKNFAEHVVAAAAASFREELEEALRAKLRPELEAALEHTVREVADKVHTSMLTRYDVSRHGYELIQRVSIRTGE